MARSLGCVFLLLATMLRPGIAQQTRPGASAEGASPDPGMPRPIEAVESVWIEELTWLEVRDAIRSGKTTVIVPTGGMEQSGPYLVTTKHNVILRATTEAIAGKLGDALVAPIVAFVPQGEIDPPSEWIRYPGTIGVSEETFEFLLNDIASSLRAHGFRHIVLIGDSGGNQEGMKTVAAELSARWAEAETRVHYVPEYYDWPGRQKWLERRGIHEVDQGVHDELSAEAMMMTVDPATVRMEERLASGSFSINGVDLVPAERTIALGRDLVDHIATETAQAIQEAIRRAEHR